MTAKQREAARRRHQRDYVEPCPHRKLKFVCRRCGHEYRDLQDLWECVEEHQGEEC